MSSTIDNRIVEMQFNNQQFEHNISKSISSLENLKKGLDLEGALKGVQNIEAAFKGFTLDPIVSALDELNGKFDAISDAGMRALNRIKDSAINAGIQMVKSLSVDQIASGMSKYESETSAIATMQYAIEGGKTAEGTAKIYKAIEKLQTYSDETSYSFSTMVDNMSKFIAAGASLDDAEKSMEGVANWAAKAGVSAQSADFARVMYNLSQAMGSGTVKVQDWMSIETAKMATRDFKAEVIDTAKRMGTLVEKDGELYAAGVKLTKKNKENHKVTVDGMRDTLKDGWLTKKVLTEVLKTYADSEEAFLAAQQARSFTDAIEAAKDAVSTGWSRSFRMIFGDINEATEFFTDLANAIITVTDTFSSFRNGMLKVWKDDGGREALVEAFWNIWHILEGIGGSFLEAFGFGDELMNSLGSSLSDATKRFRDATAAALGLFETIEKITGGETKKSSKTINKVTSDLSKMQEEARANATAVEGMINTGTVKMSEQTEKNFRDLAAAYKDLDEYIASGDVDADELQQKLDNINVLLEKTGKTNKLMNHKKTALKGMMDQLKGYKEAGFESSQTTKEITEEMTEEEKEIYYRSQRLVEIFTGLKDFFGIFADAASALKDGFLELAGMFTPFVTPVINLTTALARYISLTRKSLKANKVFTKHVKQMKDALSPITDLIVPIAGKLNEFAQTAFVALQTGNFGETKIGKILSGIGAGAEIASRAMSHLVNFGSMLMAKLVMPLAGRVGTWMLDKLAALGEWVSKVDAALRENQIFEKIRSGIESVGAWLDENLDPIVNKIQRFFKPITDALDSFFGDAGEGVLAAINEDTSTEDTLRGKIAARLTAFSNAFSDNTQVQAVVGAINGFVEPLKKALAPILDPVNELFGALASGVDAAMNLGTDPELLADRGYHNKSADQGSIGYELTRRLDVILASISDTKIAKKIEEIQGKTDEFMASIKPITDAISGFFRDTGSALIESIQVDTSGETTLKDKIDLRLQTFENAFNDTELGQRVQKLQEQIKAFFQPLLTALEPITKPVGEFFGHFWDGLVGATTANVNDPAKQRALFAAGLEDSLDTGLAGQIKQRLQIFADAFADDSLVTKVQEVATKISGFFAPLTEGLGGVRQFFTDVWGLITGLFKSGENPAEKTEDGVLDSLGSLESIAEQSQGTDSILSKVGETFWDTINWFVGGIADMVQNAISKFSVGDVWKLQGLLSSFHMLIASKEFEKLVSGLSETVQDISKTIAENFGPEGGGLKGLIFGNNSKESALDKMKKIGLSVLEIGAGIKFMAEAVSTLSAIKALPDDDGSGLVGGVSSLVGILAALHFFLNGTGNGSQQAAIKGLASGSLAATIQEWTSSKGGFGIGTGAAVIELGQALKMMAEAVQTLAGIPPIPDNDGTGLLGGVGSLILILWSLSRFLNGYDGGDVLQSMSKGEGLFAAVTKTTTKQGVFGVNTGTAILELGQALKMMAEAVQTLAGIPPIPDNDGTGLLGGVGALVGLLAALSFFLNGTGNGKQSGEMESLTGGTLITTIQKWTGSKGGFGVLTGAAVMELAQSLNMMANAVQKLAAIKPIDEGDGSGLVAGMVSILLLLGALALFLNGTGDKTKTSEIKGDGLFAAVQKLTEHTGTFGPMAGTALTQLADALTKITDAIVKLSDVPVIETDGDGKGLVAGMSSIIVLLTALGVFLKGTDIGEAEGDLKSALAGVTGTELGSDLKDLSIFLTTTADAIKKLSDVPVIEKDGDGKGLVAGMSSIIVLLTALGVFLKGTDLGSDETDVGNVIQNVAAGLSGTELGSDLGDLADFLTKTADAIIKLSDVPVINEDGDNKGLVAGVVSILAVLTGLGVLLNTTDIGDDSTSLGDIAQNTIAGVFGTELGSDLGDLADFLTKAADAVLKLSNVPVISDGDNKGLVAGVGSILALMTGVGALFAGEKALKTNIKDGVTSVLQGEAFIRIAEALQGMADATEKIAKLAKSEDADLGTALFAEGGMLAGIVVVAETLSKVPLMDSIAALVNLATFVSGFTLIFTALGELTTFTKDHGIDIVNDIGTAGDVMESLGNAIGRLIGGLVKGVMGEKTGEEETTTSEIEKVFGNLKGLSDATGGIDFTRIERTLRFFERLQDVAFGMSAGTTVSGNTMTNLQTFVHDLEGLGGGLQEFSNKLGGFDPAKADVAVGIVERLINLAERMNNTSFEGGQDKTWFGAIDSMKQALTGITYDQDLAASLGQFAGTLVLNMADAIRQNGSIPQDDLTTVLSGLLLNAKVDATEYLDVGYNMMSNLGLGIFNGSAYAGTLAELAATAVKQRIERALGLADQPEVGVTPVIDGNLGGAEGLFDTTSLSASIASQIDFSTLDLSSVTTAIGNVETAVSNARSDMNSNIGSLRSDVVIIGSKVGTVIEAVNEVTRAVNSLEIPTYAPEGGYDTPTRG